MAPADRRHEILGKMLDALMHYEQYTHMDVIQGKIVHEMKALVRLAMASTPPAWPQIEKLVELNERLNGHG